MSIYITELIKLLEYVRVNLFLTTLKNRITSTISYANKRPKGKIASLSNFPFSEYIEKFTYEEKGF